MRQSLSRLLQIRRVIKKHGLQELLSELPLSRKAHYASRLLFGKSKFAGKKSTNDRALRLRQALEELGPIYVKLGQALSTRPDLLPSDIASELTKLQDQVPPFCGTAALEMIKQRYGDDFDHIFASVDDQPMASASIAQVHAATLQKGNALKGKNGKKAHDVIIKILRPNIRQVIEGDIRIMYKLAGLLQKHLPDGNLVKPLEIIKEYDTTIHDELDLRREAANCCQMGNNFQDSDIIYVPQVYWDYTQKDIMVMERIYGTPIREIQTLKDKGYSLEQLAKDGVNVFFKQAFEDNFFHADMHPGNIFVSEAGKWIAIDFGIMGTLTNQDKQYLAENLLGFFHRDYRQIAEVHLRAGWIPAHIRVEDFEAAIRTVCEPIFAKPISKISFGNVLIQLFQTARRFEMPVQPQLILLYKTLLNIEGLGRQLYPQLNLWDTAKLFLETWMKKQYEPKYLIEELKKDWPKWRRIIPKLPEHLANSINLTTLNTKTLTEQRQFLQQLTNKQNKNHLVRFHQILGFGSALISLTIYLLNQNGIIQDSLITQISPIFLAIGLIWAYYHSRKS